MQHSSIKQWSCYIFTILPWINSWPFVSNRSYNWQCCPISSARSLNSSSKCTAKLLWSHCLCIFDISSPTRIWKEIRPWNHSGYSKWKNLRKIPIPTSAKTQTVWREQQHGLTSCNGVEALNSKVVNTNKLDVTVEFNKKLLSLSQKEYSLHLSTFFPSTS